MLQNVIFRYGTRAQYNALTIKNENTVYWLTDTGELFRGNIDFTKMAREVTDLPTTSQAAQGVIYVVNPGEGADINSYIFNGTSFTPLSKEYARTLNETSTHATVPTSKAVVDYVQLVKQELIDEMDDMVKGVDFDGMVSNPTYEEETRTITLPVLGKPDLVIALGKDLVVESGGYDYDEKEIVLTLTNGDVVKIPVADIIPVFDFIDTDTIIPTINYDTATKRTSVRLNVKLDPASDNTITATEDGLMGTALKWLPIDE